MILGFDTATADTAVAITDGGEPVTQTVIGPGSGGRPVHGRALLGAIEGAVESAGGWDRIERIAVGTGPGSFTGLRIGVSTARALAQARALPLVGVLTTAALSAGIAIVPGAARRDRLAILDARRGVGLRLARPRRCPSSPRVLPPEEIAGTFAPRAARGRACGREGSLRFRPRSKRRASRC